MPLSESEENVSGGPFEATESKSDIKDQETPRNGDDEKRASADTGNNSEANNDFSSPTVSPTSPTETKKKADLSFFPLSLTIMGNPWSLFGFKNADTQESRYHSEEEEERDRMPFSDDDADEHDENEASEPPEGTQDPPVPVKDYDEAADDDKEHRPVPNGNHQRASFAFLPNIRRNDTSAPQNHADEEKGRKRKFHIFSRKGKKDRDRKPGTVVVLDADAATGERAQQLIGSLIVGAPSINLVASCLLEDERGIARAPLLLSLLGFQITDISPSVGTKNRKFRIDLEYGVGPQRLKWLVEKTAKDLLYLHSRFKFGSWRSDSINLPRYPLPPLRFRDNDANKPRSRTTMENINLTFRGDRDKDNEEPAQKNAVNQQQQQENQPKSPTINEPALPTQPTQNQPTRSLLDRSRYSNSDNVSAALRRPLSHGRHSQDDAASVHTTGSFRNHLSSITSLARLRSHLSGFSSDGSSEISPEMLHLRQAKNNEYILQVVHYLNELIKTVGLKPQSNRLFQFFEVLPILSLLSYEGSVDGSHIGKQGVIHIGGTARSQGWRVGHFRANDLKGMIDRRLEKWLLVRNGYLMYVSDINLTLPLEVFLVDLAFRMEYRGDDGEKHLAKGDEDGDEEESDYDDSSLIQKAMANTADTTANSKHSNVFNHLKITLYNRERKLVLIPKSHKEQKIWVRAIKEMQNATIWSQPHRFESFAPVRQDCFAQWFVDARDYFWAISLALELAKDVIFIHDWWLSPELYLRRPANGNQQWRIDRILQRKAQQGVKIFVIVYRNVGTTVATDSLYTKHSILLLNEDNIHVIRLPNQLLQNTFFWAHHEKLCIIDQTVAFLGGIDLCYGRFDTPDHVLTDDLKLNFDTLDEQYPPTADDFARFQTFPGKDYSNPRVKDFFELDKPYESMYDRDNVPRMPWHDVHMVTSGKIARDLARHFVQRWNYLIRQKRPSRYTPLLLPPPDMSDKEVEELGLGGTCEVQLLRSLGTWSLGLKHHEESIQNAYLKLIETSEHFVYIENQFFITLCVVDGTFIQNRIGDALVDRIIKAYQAGETWRAVIVIPLMPGFESQVDEPEGSSVRVIMQCEYMSISQGTTSIFAKLRRYGIDPDDYIQFFSLRKWGRIGPDRNLVTEQLYIHAKTMIVDDRAVIIGSANINERLMRGLRDSEVAAVVRDRETVATTMNGKPFRAAKFAHTLRMRLMREHMGVSVDVVDIIERRFQTLETFARLPRGLDAATNKLKQREHRVLSAVVELASRDILGQKEGTFRWKNFAGGEGENGEKPKEPENEAENSDNGPEVNGKGPKDATGAEHPPASNTHTNVGGEFKRRLAHPPTDDDLPAPLAVPVSFNNRTGTKEANRGIRDKKKHSYDARVQHSDQHKRDVFGKGPDKYKTRLARRARLDSTRFLKELAHRAIARNPSAAFLPPTEEVIEFLESDDYAMVDDMDAESEAIIHERNRERLALLKKISYLQRVAAREQEMEAEEQKKRAQAGISGGLQSSAKRAANILSSELLPNSSRGEPHLAGGSSSGDIPIVSLDGTASRNLAQSLTSPNIEKFSRFVDPYCFSDPLDAEFYEDLWYEHARRNTELFRMVFHPQPDDTVLSWKDYKKFLKLQRAFVLAQQHESSRRRSARPPNPDMLLDVSDAEHSDMESQSDSTYVKHSGSRRPTINVDRLGHDVGLLGNAPPSSKATNANGSASTKLHARRNLSEKPDPAAERKQPLDTERAFGSDSSDTESAELEQEDVEPDNDRTPPANGQLFANRKKTPQRSTFSRRRKEMVGSRIFDRETAERILSEIQGHLVLFPTEWLSRELDGGNWFYNTDRIPPIEIYD